MFNNFNPNNDSRDNRRNQQQNQGGPFPPGRSPMNEPPRANPPEPFYGTPGMGQAPRTAPPNFTPQGPEMGRPPSGNQRGQGPEQFGGGHGGGDRFNPGVNPRELRRCLNRFTFIWLINGNSFWFFPTFIGRDVVQGFRWRRNRWEFDSIRLRRILFFRCF